LTEAAAFEIVPTYWPARTGIFWWENFSLEEVRRDFDSAFSLGLSTLSVSLSWSYFQPAGRGVAAGAMRMLEATLKAAEDAGLHVKISLLPVEVGSFLWLPNWALTPGSLGQRRVLSGHHLSSRNARNLYQDNTLRDAQARLIREITSEFGSHPAVAGWLLADCMTAALEPDSAAVFRDWLGLIVDSVGQDARLRSLRCGFSVRDLILSTRIDLHALTGLGIGAQIAAKWKPIWAPDSDAAWLSFLAAFAGRTSGSLAAIALSGARDGDVPAAESAGAAVRDGGAASCCLPTLFELSREAIVALPQDSRNTFALALLSSSGLPTPHGEAWLGLARSKPAVRTMPDHMPEVDPELRLRDPEGVAREAFAAFNL